MSREKLIEKNKNEERKKSANFLPTTKKSTVMTLPKEEFVTLQMKEFRDYFMALVTEVREDEDKTPLSDDKIEEIYNRFKGDLLNESEKLYKVAIVDPLYLTTGINREMMTMPNIFYGEYYNEPLVELGLYNIVRSS